MILVLNKILNSDNINFKKWNKFGWLEPQNTKIYGLNKNA